MFERAAGGTAGWDGKWRSQRGRRSFWMKASWAFVFLVVYKCDLGSTETSGVILHKVYNGFSHEF